MVERTKAQLLRQAKAMAVPVEKGRGIAVWAEDYLLYLNPVHIRLTPGQHLGAVRLSMENGRFTPKPHPWTDRVFTPLNGLVLDYQLRQLPYFCYYVAPYRQGLFWIEYAGKGFVQRNESEFKYGPVYRLSRLAFY